MVYVQTKETGFGWVELSQRSYVPVAGTHDRFDD